MQIKNPQAQACSCVTFIENYTYSDINNIMMEPEGNIYTKQLVVYTLYLVRHLQHAVAYI